MFVMAVSGEVGGVKVLVYWAVPFRMRRLEMYPCKYASVCAGTDPIVRLDDVLSGEPDHVTVCSIVPFTNKRQVEPLLVMAK